MDYTGVLLREMSLNGYELNELYHFNVDVHVLKENIFAVILLQLSEAKSFHHIRHRKGPVRELLL